MRCTRCSTDLIAGKRFCHACGAPAALQCASCGAAVAPEFRFCPDCGQAIEVGATPDTPPPVDDAFARLSRHIPEALARKIRAAQGTIEGERKQVTVLFCDLAGSTAIAERLDPEEYHDLLEEYLELAFAEIYRFEGVVNHVAGDGVMALFGAPVAHEDAPQRAIRAALRIRDALALLNDRLLARRDLSLQARIGIHTGPVVVGTLGNDLKMDYTAIGDTTNLASRLETSATPGSILVSDATLRLVRGFFRVQPAGRLAMKGKSEPVTAWEVLGEATEATPMAIAAERGLTPLVGRDEELAQLHACFNRLDAKVAQVVAVVGDAGLGKSRLAYEFKQRVAEDDAVTFFEGRCSALGQAVPFSSFLQLLKAHFGIVPGESPTSACEKVRVKLGGKVDHVTRYYPALSHLLGLDADGTEPAPEDIKRESFEAVSRLILEAAEHGPVVVLLEDLHWIDDPSRELLESLAARVAGAPVLLLVTHRPDDHATWRTRGAFTQLVLRRLSDDDVRTIVRAVAGGPLPAELEGLLIAKAEGSPFCAEEITRALVEEGYLATNGGGPHLTRPVEEIRIPGTVQEVIAARLDRVGPQAKRVVQVASVLGRQFDRVQLTALLSGEGIDVERELGGLERRGIFHRKTLLASDEYRFGESLTQEVAYEGLLLKHRRQLHERIAGALEAAGGDGGAERAALLAHHYARSDNRQKAVGALLHAGLEAELLPSYRTAADFFRRAWELADAGPQELDETGKRIVLEATSGVARLAALFGATTIADGEAAARRARELATELGETDRLASLHYFHGAIIMQGDPDHFANGLALAEEGMAQAQRSGNNLSAMRLARGLAMAYAYDGRFDLAARVIEWAVTEVEARNEPPLSDLTMSTRWVHDAVRYLSDDFDAALVDTAETYDRARRAPNRTVTSGSAATLAQISFLRGDYAGALRWAEDGLVVAEAIANVAAFPGLAAVALAARVELGEVGDLDRLLGLMAQGIASGSAVQLHVRFLADALDAVDDRAVVARFAEQLRVSPAGGRLRQAVADVVLGRLWTRLGRHDEAERAFAQALAVAADIGARSTLAAAALASAELAALRGDEPSKARHLEQATAIARELKLDHVLNRAARIPAAIAQRAAGA